MIDDLELGTNRKVFSLGILMENMKALTFTNQNRRPMLKFFKQTNGKNRWVKNYIPVLPIYRCRDKKNKMCL